MTEAALHGWRVVEVAVGVAAMFAGKLLADLGAEVVMVEPPGGHPMRWQGPARPGEQSARFAHLATGKSSVVVPDDERAVQIPRLVADAHVVITDAPRATVEGWGGVPEEVVWASIRPFGLTGPNAERDGPHLVVFHAGGEGSILPSGPGFTLHPDRPPLQIGGGVADYDAGWTATVAILAALRGLARSGRAQHIDLSAQEAQLTLNRTRLSRFNNDGVVLAREGNRYGITGMLRCADGWIQLVGVRDDQWERLLTSDAGRELRDERFATPESRAAHLAELGTALAEWCLRRPKADAAAVFADLGCPVGAYATPSDLLASEQLAHRGFLQELPDPLGRPIRLPGAPYRLSRTPVRLRPAPGIGTATGFTGPGIAVPAPGPPIAPLAGVRVLDFTWAAAGPYATLLLAFLGADVLKVESSRRPDPARRGFLTDYGGPNRSPNFSELNLDKRSIQVDLTTEAGKELVGRLLGEVDVVVDNFRPGVMERLGFGAADLLARHPELVVASSSANGGTGPEAMAAGLASIFGATGGLAEQTGYADGPPTEIGESTDYRSANALAVAVVAALLERDRSGLGQHLDLASREVVVASAPDALLAHQLGIVWEARLGNADRAFAPQGVFAGAGDDAWLALSVTDDQAWEALCRVLGRPDWSGRGVADRRDDPAVEQAIAEWARARTPAEATDALVEAGVPATPVMTNRDLASDPHLAARGVFVDVDHPEIGRQRVMRAPWLLSGTACDITRAGPLLGQDNADVLASLAVTGDDADRFREVMR